MKTKILSVLLASLCAAFASAVSAAENNYAPNLKPGSLAATWMTGGPNCVAVPEWQAHEYNEDFYILCQSVCVDAEKPFLYLIFGENKALLEDTGVAMRGPDGTRAVIPTAPVIFDLINKWAKRKNRAPVPLVVIHSHGHGDHTAADDQFKGQPNVEFIAPTPAEVSKFTGIKKWPTDIGQIDLGNRIIDVIPIPGHDVASITLYDRRTGNIMTGDSLYPGLLSVNQEGLATFAASSQRLTDFISDRPVAYVLGTHIEQKATPYADYGRGTVYQPEESALELSRAHIIEMNEALKAMKGKLELAPMPQTTIFPRAALRLQATPPPAAK